MSEIYFTADTHFGHTNIIKHCERPFSSAEEMDEAMIERWNSVVTKKDVVYHCGDVSGPGSDEHMFRCVDRLHGRIHLILGNHDAPWAGNKRYPKSFGTWAQHFASLSAFATRQIGQQLILLSHFPYAGDHGVHAARDRYSQFRLRDEGLFLVHGHVHKEWTYRPGQLNVGVDAWGFVPVSLETVATAAKLYQEERNEVSAGQG